jgi:hypothetical protein
VIKKRTHESSALWHELFSIRGECLVRELMSEIGEALGSWKMCAQNAVDQESECQRELEAAQPLTARHTAF